MLRIWIRIPYVFGLPDPFVSVTDPDPFYHLAKIVRKRNFPTYVCNNPCPLLDGGLCSLKYRIISSKVQIQAISHLSVTTQVLSWTVDSVLSNTESSLPRSKIQLISSPICNQGCGSGSGLDPDSIGSVDPDPGGQKWPSKVEKNFKVHVLKCWMASFRAEGFFCNLNVLNGGLGIGKLQFLIKKKKFSAVIFFSTFGH